MSELKFRVLQTINFLAMALFSLITQIIFVKQIYNIHPMCSTLFTLTMIIMVAVQGCNYLGKNEKGRFIAYIYFVLLCCMMYYCKNIVDIIIFVVNIGVTFSIIVERTVYSHKLNKEHDDN